MSSNLTISYTSQTAAGIAPTSAPAADAPAAGGPLGFLAALVDQLLSGGMQTDTTATASTETGAGVSLPGLVDLAISSKTETNASATSTAPDLVADVSTQLDALKSQLADGTTPAPQQLQSLNAAIDALTKAIAAPAAPSFDAGVIVQTPAPAAATAETDPLPAQQIVQLLASLGLIQPQEPSAGTATTETPTPAQPTATAISALQDKLHALSQQIAATSPALAQKLEALATKLDGVAAKPEIVAQITTPPPSQDALTIAQIVRALLGTAPAQTDTPADDKPDTNPAIPAPSADAQDQLFQILTSLGVTTAPATETAPSANPTSSVQPVTSAVPPALVRLSAQLSQVSAELAASSPDLAKKLDAVATKLVSTDANASLQAQITSAATDQDGSALDKLVQSLIDNKPVVAATPTTPQIAATADLKVPAAMVAPTPKPAKLDIAAAKPDAPVSSADDAPRPLIKVTASTPADTVVADASPKPESKLVSDIVDAVKADTATTTPAPVANTPPAAPIQAPLAHVLPTAYQTVANPINMGQVAFEMVHQIHQGASRFTIRLDPPELGRVDVKMHVAETGVVNARLVVERAETLDLFQRDQRSLERALSQAGLDSSKTSLEFSLRQNPFAGMSGGGQRPQSNLYGTPARFSSDESDEALPIVTLYRGTASAGGVNLFV